MWPNEQLWEFSLFQYWVALLVQSTLLIFLDNVQGEYQVSHSQTPLGFFHHRICPFFLLFLRSNAARVWFSPLDLIFDSFISILWLKELIPPWARAVLSSSLVELPIGSIALRYMAMTVSLGKVSSSDGLVCSQSMSLGCLKGNGWLGSTIVKVLTTVSLKLRAV